MPDQKISADPELATPSTQARLAGIDIGTDPTKNYRFTPAGTRSWLNVADGATANSTDAQLRDRSTHTGTQAASTIGSGTFALARLATGTAAAGTYIDGGTGAWTALPNVTAQAVLRYARPDTTGWTTVAAPSGTSSYIALPSNTTDYIITLPTGTAKLAHLDINGGRNICIIGGKIIPAAGSGYGLRFLTNTGNIYLEGLHIDMVNRIGDAIDFGATDCKMVTIQNCLIENVHGTNAGVHADILQNQGPMTDLRVFRLSGDTNYQGLFLAPQTAMGNRDIRKMDLRYNAIAGDSSSTLLWLFDSESQIDATTMTTTLEDVWLDVRAGQNPVQLTIYPPENMANVGAIYAPWDGTAYWPRKVRTTGKVNFGTLTTRYAQSPGLNYVMPTTLGVA